MDQLRQQNREQYGSPGEFLDSLAMKAVVEPFVHQNVPRITQLINKSNQFNLTTRRVTEAEIHGVIDSTSQKGFTIRLGDKYGDYGLINIVYGTITPDRTFEVAVWVMSCRVLNRTVEALTFNVLMSLARSTCCRRVVSRYLPSEKNRMVKDLHASLGFRKLNETPEGATYEIPVVGSSPLPTHIIAEGAPHEAAENFTQSAGNF